jgi:hypothetical protein
MLGGQTLTCSRDLLRCLSPSPRRRSSPDLGMVESSDAAWLAENTTSPLGCATSGRASRGFDRISDIVPRKVSSTSAATSSAPCLPCSLMNHVGRFQLTWCIGAGCQLSTASTVPHVITALIAHQKPLQRIRNPIGKGRNHTEAQCQISVHHLRPTPSGPEPLARH